MNAKGETGSNAKQTIKHSPPAPKRFVFDVPDEINLKANDSPGNGKNRKNSQLQKYLPLIHGFIPPHNYKDAYEKVVEYSLATYNEIRSLVLAEYRDELEVLKGTKIDGPIDCFKVLKKIVFACFGKGKEYSLNDKQQAVSEYETLLQNAELKIRDLIRNEQIYRINFDQVMMKNDEAEKIILELQEKLVEGQVVIEALTKEAAQLGSTLKQKDGEIRALILERKGMQNQPEIVPPLESPISVEPHKGKALSCTSQNLLMMLADSKLTPPNIASKILSNMKKTSHTRTPTSTKIKTIQKSGTVGDLGLVNSKEIKLSGLEKLKDAKESLKSQIGALTERKKNGSGTPGIRLTGRIGTDNLTFFASARGGGSYHMVATPDQSKTKPLSRKEEHRKSRSPVMLRPNPHEDLMNYDIKNESYEEVKKSLVLVERVEKKREETDRKTPFRVDSSQTLAAKHLRRSGVTRTRPLPADTTVNSSQKSMEQKSNISNIKPSGNIAQTHRSSKSKSIVFESKTSKAAAARSGSPFVNIMLKKFADQELNSKKMF